MYLCMCIHIYNTQTYRERERERERERARAREREINLPRLLRSDPPVSVGTVCGAGNMTKNPPISVI